MDEFSHSIENGHADDIDATDQGDQDSDCGSSGSSSNKELVVVTASDDYASFSINCKKFEIRTPPTPAEAESTPPEI